MDVVHDRASIIAEEDRISNLPDDIIHRILSYLDMKYVIQTSTLSKRWKHIWTSMPYLNLDSYKFRPSPRFAKFVKHVLSHRNHESEVSVVELRCFGAATQFAVKSMVNYAYSHNVQHLTVKWFANKVVEFPQRLFSSHTLKHLTLVTDGVHGCCLPKSAWDFPALETLELSDMQLCDITDTRLNLFSKCVNLKDLTLHGISMPDSDIFDVCAPQLCNLTMTNLKLFPKVFNVVAPQLSNLTITNPYVPKIFNVVAPQLENLTLSVGVWDSGSLQLSNEGLDSLEKVNLSMSRYSYKKDRVVTQLLDLFQKLCSAKILILDMDIIKALSSCPDQLVLEPCPFDNLKCLKMEKQKRLIATMPTHVKNYFLESSPSATFIMDLPQVAWKRSREEIDETMANKVAKLEEEKHIQDEVIVRQKVMLEEMKLQHEKLMSQIINWKMAELQVQLAGGNPDHEFIRSMGRDIKSIMELTPESLRVPVEAQLSCQYEEVKRLFLTNIDACHWAKIETELGSTSHSERFNSDNLHSQSNVPFVVLPQLPYRQQIWLHLQLKHLLGQDQGATWAFNLHRALAFDHKTMHLCTFFCKFLVTVLLVECKILFLLLRTSRLSRVLFNV